LHINTPATDTSLLREAKAGNNAAFTALVTRYEQQIAATIIGMLGYCAEADDIGQETFIRFYKALHKFRGEAKLSTYLTRIAINLSLNELKRRQRKRWFSFFSREGEKVWEVPDHLHLTEAQRQTQNMVQQALQQLAPKYRSVLVLRLLDGYSTKETAEILQLPLGTVLSRLSRGQQQLKVIISKLR